MVKIIDARCTWGSKTFSYGEGGMGPLFSWRLEGDCGQKGYEIIVRDRYDRIIWDSGLVLQAVRHNISCPVTFEPCGKFSWTLTCFGTDGSMDAIKGPEFYSGLDHWKAKWVAPDRKRKPLTDSSIPHASSERQKSALDRLDPPVYMRKGVTLEEVPDYAAVYASAHGIYELWVNGISVSDFLAPGYTSYKKRLEYQVYDITPLLKLGKNVIGVVLADGWYTGKIGAVGIGEQYGKENAFLMQIECRYHDGRRDTFCTGQGMKWTEGAWQYADLFVGEYYDAGKKPKGWLEESYSDQNWKAVEVCDFDYKALCLQSIPPVQEQRVYRPEIFVTPKGEMVVDAGETTVGYLSFRLNLKKGQTVSLEYSETLDKEGNFLQNIIGQNKQQTDYYCCAEDGICEWRPRFSYHGYRYVRITGTQDSNPEHYKVHVIGTPLRQTGEFRGSDERLNRLHKNILRSQRGNMICIPTDCPQRERTGWTGDIQLYAPTACYEQDVEQFLRHWLEDVQNEQLDDGQIPHIVPYMPSHDIMKPEGTEGVSAAGWSDAAVIVPWRLYEAYGDETVLKENFPMMLKYMKSVEQRAARIPKEKDSLAPEELKRQKYLWNADFQFGDWLMPSVQMAGASIMDVAWETGEVVATLLYALTTDIMAKVCQILEETDLMQYYRELNRNIRTAFYEEYMNQDGTLKKEYQGIYVLALETGAVPESLRPSAVSRLADLIHKNNDLLDTGFLSVPYLLPVLHANGQKELANRLLFRDECPSWLYEVKMGATTMWEYWNGYAEDGTPNNCSMNHFAFGCVGEYLYRTILGICPSEPGYKKVRIEPDFTCGLHNAEGAFESIWGKISVSWKLTGDTVYLDVVIPPDVEAVIILGEKKKMCGCGTWHIIQRLKRQVQEHFQNMF